MARIKVNDSEKLDDTSIQKVIDLLHPIEDGVKPISKKDACAILCISYNTARLEKIIQNYLDKKALRTKRKAEKRGKPATSEEVIEAISSYLKGETLSEIADSLFRSTGFVKRILEDNACPIRPASRNYFSPELIPEGAARDRFAVGTKVYSARYDSLAIVRRELPPNSPGNPYNEYGYAIYLLDEYWSENAYQPAYELASIDHLVALGVKL